MPWIENKPKTISQRHYFGGGKGVASAVRVTNILETVANNDDSIARLWENFGRVSAMLSKIIDVANDMQEVRERTFCAFMEPQIWVISNTYPTVVPYNMVKINGDFYDNKDYSYRVPFDGAYLFGASFLLYGSGGAILTYYELGIYKNGNYYATLAYSSNASEYIYGAIPIECVCGDKIDIRIVWQYPSGSQQTTVDDKLYGFFHGSYQGTNQADTGAITPPFIKPS